MSQGILYISYDGMLEPLGQSQVLAYLEKLAPGRRVHLISFEKPYDWQETEKRTALADRLRNADIKWHPIRYSKRPPVISTVWDMVKGTRAAARIARRERISVFHGRNMLCAAMAMPARAIRKGMLIVDIRGFWADERVDGGIIRPNGLVYRVLKSLERAVLRSADQIVTLTQASVGHLRDDPAFGHPRAPITVIPTCVDLERFSIQGPPADHPFVLGYIGSIGTWYLLDEMLGCFRLLQQQEPDARLLFVNRAEWPVIRQRAAAMNIAETALELTSANHRDMPRQIGRMTAGMALIKPAFSKISSAPTKLAEYLACGVPCLGNAGVGDVESVLEGNRVGVAVRALSDTALTESVSRLRTLAREGGIQDRCRRTAVDLFSLEQGVDRFDALYRSGRKS